MMPALFVYLLQVNAALVLFYLAYRFLLRPLTFYTLNRFFLVFGIAFSLAYPRIDVSWMLNQPSQLSNQLTAVAPDWRAVALLPAQAPVPGFWQVLTILFWAGSLMMALRLLGQFYSLYRIHQQSKPACHEGMSYRQVTGQVNPFSFWQTAYLNPDQHCPEELISILRHEHIHVRQWHTLDVLLGEFSTVLCWFNPGAWLFKQAVKENLEFLTDHQVLQSGVDSKAYQYSLLHISDLAQGASLVNNFNFLTIKKRITMMNKKPSSRKYVARYAVLAPLIAAPLFILTACSEEPVATAPQVNQVPASEPAQALADVVYYIDGEEVSDGTFKKLDTKEIESVNVFKGESAIKVFGDKGGNGVIAITTKKNKNASQVIQFNEKLQETLKK